MDLVRLPAEEAAVRRFLAELWVPYHRELAATVERHALADDVDLVAAELPVRLDRLGTDGVRTWVAVAGPHDAADLAAADGTLVGFVTTEVDASPPVFAGPDQLVVGDLYVRESHRGTGLGRRLVDRARERARAAGCAELRLEVDVDNERARAFYERLGFEPVRHTMVDGVDA